MNHVHSHMVLSFLSHPSYQRNPTMRHASTNTVSSSNDHPRFIYAVQ